MLRDLAGLARLPNLPTVAGNVTTGYLVGLALAADRLSGTTVEPEFSGALLATVIAVGCLLYVFGTFLNDAVDASWDAKHRPERAIPAGRLSRQMVENLALLWGGVAVGAAVMLGKFSLAVAACLVVSILLYTWLHKRTPFAVLFMGVSRGLLYPLGGLAGLVILGDELRPVMAWLLALGGLQVFYVAGLSMVARSESTGGGVRVFWMVVMAMAFLLPLAFSAWWLVNMDAPPTTVAWPLWAAASLGVTGWFWFLAAGRRRSTPVFVARALAGIALVDVLPLLFLAYAAPGAVWVAVAAAAACLVLQRLFRSAS